MKSKSNNLLFPSIDKPWLKHYENGIPDLMDADCSNYDFILNHNNTDEAKSRIALEFFGTKITFKELFESILHTAGSFKKLGIKKGDIVTVCSILTPEIVYTFYALNLIGAITNAVDPRYSVEGIKEYIEEADCKWVISLNIAYPKIAKAVAGTAVEKVIIVSPADSLKGFMKLGYKLKNPDKNSYADNTLMWKDLYSLGTPLKEYKVNSEDCTLIVHTGGTTGISKGVCLSARAINSLVLQYTAFGQYFSPGQKYLNVMPPFIAYGFNVGVHLPLTAGVTSIIIPSLDPKELGKLLLKHKPAHMSGVPAHFQTLRMDSTVANKDLSFLVSAGAGGDAISTTAEEEVNCFLKDHNAPYKMAKGYGMTELSSTVSACIGDFNKLGSVGLPLCHTVIGIFDPDTGEELPCGSEGEVCVNAPQMMIGYYKNEAETRNIRYRHEDGRLWLHSGDIGYVDEDGYLFIVGRIKRIIIRPDGFKVFPYLIEDAISSSPMVDRCCCVGRKDPESPQGMQPFVYLTLSKEFKAQNSGMEDSEILKMITEISKEKLAEYQQPCGYEIVDELPYTPIGKVDYRKLERRLAG